MSRPDTPPNIYKNGRLKTRDELGLSATNDLLCCPFCGGSDIDPSFARGYEGGDETKPIIAAGCFTCSSTGPDVPVPSGEDGYKEATEVWNKRAT